LIDARRLLGLRVVQYYGNVHRRSSTDINLGTCDADKAVCVSLEHSGIVLDERTDAYLQCALLYTTVSGERRVRTLNITVSVSSLAGNVFRHADQEAVTAYWVKKGNLNPPHAFAVYR
jgi:protein transport protein SEC24